MEHLWSTGAHSAKGVHHSLGRRRGITVNTIQSTLERLYRKKLATRGKVSHAYVYSPALTREQLMGRLIGDVISSVSGSGAEQMLSAFVDFAVRADKTHLNRLERLIAERRKAVSKDRS